MEKNEFEHWQMDGVCGMEGNILRAMAVYERKSGRKADLVLVNPADLAGKTLDCVGFEVQAVKTVLQGTIWIGVKNGEDQVC